MWSRAFLVPASALVLAACGGRKQKPPVAIGDVGGTLVIAAPAEVSSLLPPLAIGGPDKQVVDQLFDPLADIGPDLNTVGDAGWTARLAQSWTWSRDSLSIAFHLNPRARWHDGKPVRAIDVRFSTELYKDPAVATPVATNLENVDSVSVADSLTAVVWFKRRAREQFYQVAYNLIPVPEHLLRGANRADLAASDYARRIVGNGPFRFVSWTPRQELVITADTGYYLGRPRLDRIVWVSSGDTPTAVKKLVSGEADFVELLNPPDLVQIESTPTARTVGYRGYFWAYLGFNLHDATNPSRPHPLFGERALRVALSMAMDRSGMLKNVFDSLAVVPVGPFPRVLATADTTIPQFEYDTSAAKRMLDSLGWRDSNRDGIRDRGGVPLRFSLMVPLTSVLRQRYAVLIQEQLRRVGAQVDIRIVDPGVMGSAIDAGRIDAVLQSMGADPSPQSLEQSFKTQSGKVRGFNVVGYANPVVDALFDSSLVTFDPQRNRELFGRVYRTIVADAPAVWLYEPRPHAGVHSRIRTDLGKWDTWWRGMRTWWIPPAERIPRDRMGLATPQTAASWSP
jgi:peptide/nickel transport system substrate-binding protein